ncbi:DUF1349 domain-containing protein [Pseudomonas fulva]|uniref:DUF1349 domain-containing protein n=1 Tax=Pseudomonas fulva TaxID=47880 RepID=UPI0018AB0C1C|nr:DUF1349 domain-containing protein [Pseudomonas fulva]MBF8774057.1 DUF1349 domain-containing protein [Pseudomonas fulva]
MFEQFSWLNEPESWSVENDVLDVVTDKDTDFWRKTFYGFERDSGHFFGALTGASFTAQVKVSGDFEELYDQAGLMVRVDALKWAKISVEINDGVLHLSTVVNNEVSDWSTSVFLGQHQAVWLRATVESGSLRVQASYDGLKWPLIRLAPFPNSESYLVGPMACSPKRGGLKVRFSDLTISPANGKELHDLS